jgi:hypothetical protein
VARLKVFTPVEITTPLGVWQSSDDRSVKHILVFSMRSIGSKKCNIVGRKGTVHRDGNIVDGKFVGGEMFAAMMNICK